MKPATTLKKILKVIAFSITGIALLVIGTVAAIYSPWLQDSIRVKIVERMNSREGTTMTLDRMSIGFPLEISLEGLCFVEQGDTVAAASRLEASVALLPLVKGEARISHLELERGRFRLGSPDSALFMAISTERLDISPASIELKTMDIGIESGSMTGTTVAMSISPDTTSTAKDSSDPSGMKISVGELSLHDLAYKMRLLPAIDSLGASIAEGKIREGLIDMASQRISLGSFSGNGLSAAYIAPDSATVAATPAIETYDTLPSAPWTVTVDTVSFTNSNALYTTRGVNPLPGLDFGYIELDSIDLKVHDLFNRSSELRLPLSLQGVERCGVKMDVSGMLAIDSSAMRLDSFKILTGTTTLDVDALIGMGDLTKDPSLPLRLDASGWIGVDDMRKMFPAFKPYFTTLPSNDRIITDLAMNGTTSRLDIDNLDIAVNGCVSIHGNGYVGNINDTGNLSGDISLSGSVVNLNRFKNDIMAGPGARSLTIPPMSIDGRVRMSAGMVDGKVNVHTGGGALALDGRWNSRGEDYEASLDVNDFPVETFMPLLGLGKVTASAKAKGHGYDPFGTTMNAEVGIDVEKAEYGGYEYRDISAKASLHSGNASISINSDNPDTRIQLLAEGNLDGNSYDWTIIADGNKIDLQALKMAELESELSFNLSGRTIVSSDGKDIKATMTLNDMSFRQPATEIGLSGVIAELNASDSLTYASIRNRDMTANFVSPLPLDSIMDRFSSLSVIIKSQMADPTIDMAEIHETMPQFSLDVRAGSDNAITDILSSSKTSFRSLKLDAVNDSTLRFGSKVLGLNSGSTRIDTISLDMRQHGEYMGFKGHIGNRPGTFDEWAKVNLDGFLDHNRIGARLTQRNIKDRQGFDIGMNLSLEDSTATLRLTPLAPVIGYQTWKVNPDNFISYHFPTKHVDANLVMGSGDSKVELFTEHVENDDRQEDLVLRLSDINIADWVSINPFAPPIKGTLDADIRLNRVEGNLNGQGSAGIDNFYYGKERVASMKLDFDVTTTPGGMLRATSDVYIDGLKTITLSGNLNDTTSTSPYQLDFSMIRFPLATVNPFLPPKVAKLRGVLNGTMQISGDSDAPVFNGYLDFDSTAVKLYMTGAEYTFSDEKIPVTDNLISLDNFTVHGLNDRPLTINGNVDINSLSSPKVDLSIKADNMQIVNSSRAAKGADLYGKAFVSLDSRIHGDMRLLFIDADMRIVPPTNVTYVMPEATSAISSQSTGDMVKFVNFSDSTAVVDADSIATGSMAMILDASLTIENGTTIGVDLSTSGNNRVQVESSGTLNYTLSPLSDDRLTGRLSINNGYVRYTPPFMSEKNFAFDNNSYIAFNGDMMNPTLGIHATEVLKANVTQQGQNSRLVNFDVGLNVTGTLNRMDVSFDLSTKDDATVANELQSMTAEQRANQAMNLLLYGIYTGPGTKGDTSLSNNALFSFLESQINGWAANNIKGIDLSFGIDQYDKTIDGTSSQTTNYSYQVSKSLFNDRFKIVVGGNYSTDANADENFSQNLISDISFEYFLNRAHTMYVRIFRHTGFESILEGEITQTGVGFVYRRKLNRLSDMFKFLKKKNKTNEATENDK